MQLKSQGNAGTAIGSGDSSRDRMPPGVYQRKIRIPGANWRETRTCTSSLLISLGILQELIFANVENSYDLIHMVTPATH